MTITTLGAAAFPSPLVHGDVAETLALKAEISFVPATILKPAGHRAIDPQCQQPADGGDFDRVPFAGRLYTAVSDLLVGVETLFLTLNRQSKPLHAVRRLHDSCVHGGLSGRGPG